MASIVAPGVTLSRAVRGPVVAHGSIASAGAQARRGSLGGIPVVATAWPKPEELVGLREGDVVSMSVVAVALTDDAGNFELRLDEQVSDYERGESIDLVIETPTVASSGAESVSAVAGRAAADRVEIELAGGAKPLVNSSAADVRSSTAAAATAGACGMTVAGKKVPKLPMTVGTSYSTNSKVSAKFTYLAGATTSVDSGTSVGGGWSASGSVTVTASAQSEYAKVSGAHRKVYRKYQDYQYFHYTKCPGSPYPVVPQTDYFRPVARPYGSFVSTDPVLATATRCTTFSNAVTFTEDKAAKYGGGVSSKGSIGITLGAQTGWNAQTTVRYSHATKGTFTLCGSRGIPERDKDAGVMVAK